MAVALNAPPRHPLRISQKSGRLSPKFDALDPVVMDDPYPTYAELRRTGALCRGGPATWAVTSYADVAPLLRDPRLGHRFPEEFRAQVAEVGGDANALLQRIVASREPPEHNRLRLLMTQAVSHTLHSTMRSTIAQATAEVLDAAANQRTVDAIADIALPLQAKVSCALLGVPAADHEALWPRAVDLGRALIPFVADDGGTNAAPDDAAAFLRNYVLHLVDERRTLPAGDVLSAMLAVEAGGDRLDDDEIVDNAVFLFFAGFETAVHLVASGCGLLADHPDQYALLRERPGLSESAVEEVLRYDAPIQWMARYLAEPVTVAGRAVRAGRVLLLLLGSANRDENQFPAPDRFDVTRSPNAHVSFGSGSHRCLGAALARAEANLFFAELARRFRRLEVLAAWRRRPHPNLRGFATAPLQMTPA